MKILRIGYRAFRNLKSGEFLADDGINVIYGQNAQGKTNLLEAIWLFSGAKSFRGSKDSEMIEYGQNNALLKLDFFAEQRQQKAEIKIESRRQASLNDIPLKSAAELAGKIKAVVFSPSHLSLIKDGPAERRKFLDTATSQIWPKYISVLWAYSRAISQRNSVLKDIRFHSQLIDMLEIFEEEISQKGAMIIGYRMKYMKLIKEFAPDIYAGLSSGKESFEVEYKTVCEQDNLSKNEYEKMLKEKLFSARQEDINMGATSVGPHRDDLSVLINGKPARNFGSQGQQRSAVLALKLAEAAVLKKMADEQPVALLDDVMSELDLTRQDYILNHISDWQVFITCCDKNTIGLLKKGKSFQMKNGEIFSD